VPIQRYPVNGVSTRSMLKRCMESEVQGTDMENGRWTRIFVFNKLPFRKIKMLVVFGC